MQAVRIHEYGPPSKLVFEQVPDPEPAAGEVVVELRAAAVNRRDTAVRRGAYGDFPLPLTPGSDGAGIRRDTGEEVVIHPGLRWGDREDTSGPEFGILGGPEDGTYAELVKIPAENVYPKPAQLSWEEAATLGVAGLTAYRALFTRAGLSQGETVLVLGAGSGVATFAVPARNPGRGPSPRHLLERREDRAGPRSSARRAASTTQTVTGRKRCSSSQAAAWMSSSTRSERPGTTRCAACEPGGRAVVMGATGGGQSEMDVRPFYLRHLSLLGTTLGSPRDFERFLELVAKATWRPVIDSVRPLAEAAAAHERMEAGEHFGKLVLAV